MGDVIIRNYNDILTKAGDINDLEFRTLDDKQLVEINSWMPEVNRAVGSFNKQNSQTSASLMTLTMLDSSPLRTLRQILAQVESKRKALNENVYRIEKKKLQYEELEELCKEATGIQLKKLQLKKNKIACDIVDAQGPIEGALKEIGAYKRRYEEICKNFNISENWNEQDFEDQEIEHHIKSIFRNAIRDRMQGAPNQGTMEYMEQFGINPITAYTLVDKYIGEISGIITNEGKGPDINTLYNFYEQMYHIFKDEYKKAMQRIGLDHIAYADFLMK